MFTAKLTKNQIAALICLALAVITTALYLADDSSRFHQFR